MLDKNFKNLAQRCVMSTPKIKEHMLKDGKLYIQEYIEQKKKSAFIISRLQNRLQGQKHYESKRRLSYHNDILACLKNIITVNFCDLITKPQIY